MAFPEALKSSEDGAFYKSMFLNEAALAGKLHHPHIVQIFDAVVEDEFSYIVMEFVEGGTLEKFCEPAALLDPAEVAEIIFKCVRALAFAQPPRPHAPRHQAGQHPPRRRHRHQDRRLRRVHQHGLRPHGDHQRGLARLHGAGAHHGRRAGLGRHRHLRARRGDVLPARRAPAVLGRQHDERHLPDREHRARAARRAPPGAAPGPGRDRRSRRWPRIPPQRYATWEEFGQALAEVWKKLHQAGRARAVRHRALQPLPHALVLQGLSRRTSCGRCCASPSGRKFPPNTALIKEGDHGDSFFILAGGYVRVTRGKRTLSVLTAGDCFGEMSYLAHKDAPHRSATVTTTSDCIVDEDPRRGPARRPRSPAGGSSTSASSTRWSSASRPPTSSSP